MQQDWSHHELWDSTWSRNFYTILMRFCFELSRLLPRMFFVGHPHRVWWPRMRVAIDDWFSRNGSRWLAKMCVGGLSPFVFCFLLILFVCFFLLLFLHSAFTKRLFFFHLSLSLSLSVRPTATSLGNGFTCGRAHAKGGSSLAHFSKEISPSNVLQSVEINRLHVSTKALPLPLTSPPPTPPPDTLPRPISWFPIPGGFSKKMFSSFSLHQRFSFPFSSFTGFQLVLLSFTGFYLVLLSFTGFYLVLLGFT